MIEYFQVVQSRVTFVLQLTPTLESGYILDISIKIL